MKKNADNVPLLPDLVKATVACQTASNNIRLTSMVILFLALFFVIFFSLLAGRMVINTTEDIKYQRTIFKVMECKSSFVLQSSIPL
jgi:uncharacterized membrane protein